MTLSVIGWDIGGAHLKAVALDTEGRVVKAIQLVCQLWRGTQELSHAIQEMLTMMEAPSPIGLRHAVTMTGELVDLFPNRHVGVLEIAKITQAQLGNQVDYYAGNLGFIAYAQLNANTLSVASMNWHASAQWMSRHIHDGLLIDIGSTTTDIVPIMQQKIAMPWRTDAERLSHNALVYTGVVRTPLMALAQTISFKDSIYHVAAEHFATTADVYRLLGMLLASDDDAETADGQDKTITASARRIARMIGHDVEDAEMEAWVTLAKAFSLAQISLLTQAILPQLSYQHGLIGAGAGSFLVKTLASNLGVPYHYVGDWIQSDYPNALNAANVCFPAYAVAQLIHHAT
jgi:(4-(4-[2-(gamma-L-glutamylamino)ethyl]phenoxymethyl)furan-2-yl)methanamine synthase